MALSTLGIVAVVYGITRAGDKADWTRADVLVALLGGLLALAVFAVAERHTDHPALDVTLFRQAAFTAGATVIALSFFSLLGLSFVASYYLQGVRAASPLHAGVLLLPAAIGLIAGSAIAPVLARSAGLRLVTAAGMLIVVAGQFSILWVGRNTATWAFELPILASGLGQGLALAPATEAVMSAVPRERAGAGSAVNSTLRLIGIALGVAVLGSELTALVTHADDAFVSAMHAATACGGTVSLAGAVVAFVWLPGRRRPAMDRQ